MKLVVLLVASAVLVLVLGNHLAARVEAAQLGPEGAWEGDDSSGGDSTIDQEPDGVRDFDLPEDSPRETTTSSPTDGGQPPFELGRWLHLDQWVKLIFNPLGLLREICRHFGLPGDKSLQRLGLDLVRGLEPLLYPLVYSVRLVERIFQPDQCRLKFVCSMGHHLEFVREHVLKFSPNFLEGSSHLRALSEGVVGRDCSAVFPECELKLTSPFSELAASARAHQVAPAAPRPSAA